MADHAGLADPLAELLDGLDPRSAAVLVVDLQNDFCDAAGAIAKIGADVSSSERMIEPLVEFLGSARVAGALIVFVKLAAEPGSLTLPQRLVAESTGRPALRTCRAGTWGADLHRSLRVGEGDLVITKRLYSAFAGTNLETELRERQVDHVIVTGTTANVCVQATAMDAYLRDFGVVVLRDLVGFTKEELAKPAFDNLASYYGLVCRSDALLESWERRETS